MMGDLLTATEIVRQIRAGGLSPVAAVEACLQRIDEVEPTMLAWVHVDRAGALAAARALEAEARAGRFRGPLHGVPVGIKDIFHVGGMVTTSGAGAFAHERPEADASSVARLTQAGAVILGKTATTEFAYGDPAPTRNPWNLEHTPGGSSSGSAAGVAAGMMPLALGSQTVGSVLRPAAYCGVVGLKPTHGRISAAGVTPLAWSLDHVGVFARSVEDAALALSVLAGHDPADPCSAAVPTADYLGALARSGQPPRLGIPKKLFSDKASPGTSAHLEAIATAFAKAGAVVEGVSLPPSAEAIHDAGQLVMRVEAAAYHRERFARHADSYRPKIRGLIEEGMAIPGVEYVRAQQARRKFREEMGPVLEQHDALLMPVAPAPAPKGLHWTGDPGLCAPWSFAGLPSIALPSGLDPEGLPLAVQLVAGPFEEYKLLSVARWCEAALDFRAAPPDRPA